MSYQTNYYKSGEPYHSFRYSSYGNRTINCTIHHISDKVLYQLVLRSIQRLSRHIIADERGFAEELKCKWEAQVNSKPQKQKDELQIIQWRQRGMEVLQMFRRKAEKRIAELSPDEAQLLRGALLAFRNKLLSAGKSAEDVNELIIKVMR